MKQTKARKQFKEKFGQQNHFLITSLIGLDYIEHNEVHCPESFSTSWNPKDKIQSTRRSREFILQSFLTSAVDGIDMYISLLNTAPKYITEDEFTNIISAGERSVFNKVKNITKYLNSNKLLRALCLALITYRNNLLHSMADNNIDSEDRNLLLSTKDLIEEEYCGLQIETVLQKMDNKKAPTFKEVASFIKATHLFVENIDDLIIKNISDDFYLKTLKRHFKYNSSSFDKYCRFPENERKRLIENIFENSVGIPKSEMAPMISQKLLEITKTDLT